MPRAESQILISRFPEAAVLHCPSLLFPSSTSPVLWAHPTPQMQSGANGRASGVLREKGALEFLPSLLPPNCASGEREEEEGGRKMLFFVIQSEANNEDGLGELGVFAWRGEGSSCLVTFPSRNKSLRSPDTAALAGTHLCLLEPSGFHEPLSPILRFPKQTALREQAGREGEEPQLSPGL